MAYVPIVLPPGVVRKGTEYQSKNRWYDADLMRWRAGAILPIGGWTALGAGQVIGAARTIFPWRDNISTAWAGIGTHARLFVCDRSGTLSDITPAHMIEGRRDAAFGGGYGSSSYGSAGFGAPRIDASVILDATMWSLDTFGPYLVGVSPDDQRILEWTLETTARAQPVANAPPCAALFASNEHMIFALAANGDPRQVAWCDQADNTLWEASNTNTAGSVELQTSGRLMCGKRAQAGNLIWSDLDLWLASIVESELIYAFEKVGDGCGVCSRGAAVVVGSQAAWMGYDRFFLFNGYAVEPLNCDVEDLVFSNINRMQISKVTCFYNSQYGEIWWLYPSSASIEIDSYVVWSTRENWWSIGKLQRLSACDRNVLPNPLMVDISGQVWTHEVTGAPWGGALPYLRSGPYELGAGDQVLCCRQLIPDEATLGGVEASFDVRFYPEGPQTTYGPYSLAARTDLRFTARQVEITLQATAQADFRIGDFRIEGVPGGLR